MTHFFRLVATTLLACLLAGCGVKTAYNNADWLLMRWINDRVSLDDSQEQMVREALDRHLAWHCASELPRYAEFLRRVDGDVAAGRISPDQLATYGDQASTFGERLFLKVRPTLIDLLASLDDAQVTELMASFEERNESLREESGRYLTTEAIEERAEGLEKGMRRFTGRLTAAQRARILDWAGNMNPTAAMALERRLTWQARFADVMARRADRPAFDEAITALMQPDLLISEPYRTRREENRRRTLRTLAELHAMAPADQVEKLRESLADVSEDLEQLSCS